MSKSPEEYFQEQDFGLAPQGGASAFTESELAFMRKYMGIDPTGTLKGIGISAPEASPVVQSEAHRAVAPLDAPQADPVMAEIQFATAAPMENNSAVQANLESISSSSGAEIETALAQPPGRAKGIVCLDADDLETFKETASQQFIGIKGALQGLALPEAAIGLPDTLYRGFNTIKNGASYLALEDIRIYAERTAGLVDQCRKSGGDFSVMVPMLEQEAEILEDMVAAAVAALESRLPAPPPRKAEGLSLDAEPVLEAGDAEMLAMAEATGLDREASSTPPGQAPAISAPVAAFAQSSSETQAAPVAQQPTAAVKEAATDASRVEQGAPAQIASDQTVHAQTVPAGEREVAAPVAAVAAEGESNISPAAPTAAQKSSEDSVEEPLEVILRGESELQMVGFFLGKQEFTVPTLAVQEVIRYEKPARLPSSPEFVAGVINLRGKMTPLVYLRDILEVKQERESEDRFIVVCRRKGLQIGLIIERVHTMYRVPQKDIDWNIESFLGVNADFVSGLLKLNGTLVGIVSVDRIVDYVLN